MVIFISKRLSLRASTNAGTHQRWLVIVAFYQLQMPHPDGTFRVKGCGQPWLNVLAANVGVLGPLKGFPGWMNRFFPANKGRRAVTNCLVFK